MRLKLRARAAVYIKASFNIDKYFYNELIYNLDEFFSFVFGDIIFIYQDLTVQPNSWDNAFGNYFDMNLCWAFGYNYNDITMSIESLMKFPNCYKMVVQSLCDWTQWTDILFKPQKVQPYLFGLLDSCTMSDDSPFVTLFDYSPVTADSGDVFLNGNDILSAPTTANTLPVKTKGIFNNYYYNDKNAGIFDKSCLF